MARRLVRRTHCIRESLTLQVLRFPQTLRNRIHAARVAVLRHLQVLHTERKPRMYVLLKLYETMRYSRRNFKAAVNTVNGRHDRTNNSN